jgi:D-inositol-3-phosphate glycosyltransferase
VADWGNARKIARQFRARDIELLWIRESQDMSVVGLAKRFYPGFNILYQQGMQLGISKKDWIHTQRFKRIDHWISPLNFLAEQVKTKTRYPHERINVVPLALETETWLGQSISRSEARKGLRIDSNALVLGLIGRIDPQKGQRFLVSCLPRLLEDHPRCEILLVGETTRGEHEDYLAALHADIAGRGLQDKVHLHPFMADPRAFFAATDIMVMASQGETFGMVTIEAMLAGCPVIGTNAAGTPEILDQGEFGVLYEVDDQDSFVETITPLLVNPQLRKTLAEKARTQALQHYDHHKICERLERIVRPIDQA